MAVTTPELLASPLTPAEKAELAQCEAAILPARCACLRSVEALEEAWIGEGEALSRLRHLQAHRDQRTLRGRPIPTEAGRWKAYLEQEHGLTVAEADAAIRAFHLDLARQHHRAGGGNAALPLIEVEEVAA
jgi:hypothetical protein